MTSTYGRRPDLADQAAITRWFLGDVTRTTPPIRLICLPHAGGCASSYRRWLVASDTEIGVLAIQLPGRETRIEEPPQTRLTELVAQLSVAVRTAGFPRIALFGHSMGALIATELCRSLESAGCAVEALVVSGHAGPDHRASGEAAYLDDEALVGLMASLDTSVGERVADPALRELFLPLVRADILVAANDLGSEPVAAPITVIVHLLPGDHFYLAHQGAAVLRIVRAAIRSSKAGTR